MYALIESIIDHVYITQGSNAQSYIYPICGALLLLFVSVITDLIYRIFRSILKKGD